MGGAFLQLKVYERGTFSVKMVSIQKGISVRVHNIMDPRHFNHNSIYYDLPFISLAVIT